MTAVEEPTKETSTPAVAQAGSQAADALPSTDDKKVVDAAKDNDGEKSAGKPDADKKAEEKPKLPVGSVNKLKLLQERFNKGDAETVEVDSLTTYAGADAEFALVARQVYTDKNKLELTRVTINSPHILKAFRDVVGSYPTLPVDFTQSFDMEQPNMLFHYWDELSAYREGLGDGEARDHLDVLFDYMNQDLAKEKRVIDAMINKQQIDFERLWYIYRPGDLVVMYQKGQPWLMEISKTFYEEDPKCGKFLRLEAVYTDYDGTNIGISKHAQKLLQRSLFGQASPSDIKGLPIFPRKFLSEGSELEERLIARGKKFLQLEGVSIKHYNGLADHLKSSPPSYWNPEMEDFPLVWLPYTESGRIVVARSSFQEDHYLQPVAKLQNVTEHDELLCPPFSYGYSVSRKEWGRFYLDSLHETTWTKDPFDSLILEKRQMSLIRALVASHKFPENSRNAVEQKGKGLVVLLHGPPGSGKTLTAECAAEETQRALFSTSMSELNRYNEAYWFEEELKKVLRLATAWKSVVLFDEADVFLEARGNEASGQDAATRNALVAVFLRHLEYFSGIVFLTTNRIHVFDAAMKSRVHLALGYNAPGEESRRLIWNNILDKIPTDEREASLHGAVDALAARDLNGREISNTVTTALTLARHDKSPLDISHIESVLDIRLEFEQNLRKMGSSSVSTETPVLK